MTNYRVKFKRPNDEIVVSAASKLEAAEKVMSLYPDAQVTEAIPSEELPEVLPMNREPGTRHVIGYMDLVDFEFELGAAQGGNRIYPSVEELTSGKKCISQCGIVEVKVEAVRIVKEGDY